MQPSRLLISEIAASQEVRMHLVAYKFFEQVTRER